MEILTESEIKNDCEASELIDIDEDRLNELIQLAKHFYPDVPDYFIHGIAVEQVMIEAGHEPNEEVANELYKKAQEELKNTEYNIKIEKKLSD
jgi:hypothetical protein